jgi:hypothetical protein
MLKTLEFAPGAVAANTQIDLPANTLEFAALSKVEVITLSDGTAAGAISEKTIVTGTPAAGEARLVDKNTIELGDATTARDIIRLTGVAYGSALRVA